MIMILRSTFVNDEAFDIANDNCLPEHNYLIKYYWKHNYRDHIIYNNLYCGNNQINEKSIIRSLTK